MKLHSVYITKTILLFLIIQAQIYGQNVGIGTDSPTSNLHLKGEVQNITALDLDYEEGVINPESTSGDYDWYITSTDGYNSAKCAKAPLIFSIGETAVLHYPFSVTQGKEVIVSFDYKYDDPNKEVLFSISSDGFSFVPSDAENWRSYSTTFVSQSASDVLKVSAQAFKEEAFPTIHLDNVMITYKDGHALQIDDGTQGEGLILQSDELGQTEWYDFRGEVDQKIIESFQDLEFDYVQNALGIENGNFVLIQALKNNFGKTVELLESEILVSPGMSLHLPSSGGNNTLFKYDADNGTMDWGLESDSPKGENSTRWGRYNVASGWNGTSWGSFNTASGLVSTAWGRSNNATDLYSTSFGKDNISSGELATTWGEGNLASKMWGTAWGNDNIAFGINSTAWGAGNIANGENSTAWGIDNNAQALEATIWGRDNFSNTDAFYSTVWGLRNKCLFSGATAWGFDNTAYGLSSTCFGGNNIANSTRETVFGRFNDTLQNVNLPYIWDNDDILLAIGNGSSESNRKNALTLLKNGNLGIGLTVPNYDLHLQSNSAAKPSSSSWIVASDSRLKKDVSSFDKGLKTILAIDPVWFTYNGEARMPEERAVGTIAQELEEVAPFMVVDWNYRDKAGNTVSYKAVDYGAMDFVLINAIKEQHAEIESLKLENAELKTQIKDIISLNSELSAKVTEILEEFKRPRSLMQLMNDQELLRLSFYLLFFFKKPN